MLAVSLPPVDNDRLLGERIAVTGAMSGPLSAVRRRDVMAVIRGAGARTATAVSASTTMLVASRSDTRKSVRAGALGVRVVSPGELAIMLGYPALF